MTGIAKYWRKNPSQVSANRAFLGASSIDLAFLDFEERGSVARLTVLPGEFQRTKRRVLGLPRGVVCPRSEYGMKQGRGLAEGTPVFISARDGRAGMNSAYDLPTPRSLNGDDSAESMRS